ncbi:MAG: DoxX-like family protein [Pseudomonadales bacterium]|nr:DoxX-like family protein [Pseudomonadales bacterium]
MEHKLTTDQIARWFIGFTWIYHGIATKLITIAPIEYYLSSQFGLGEQGTFLFIKLCGIVELAFGVIFIIFYRNRALVYANILR